jgi:hypothetical protein
MRGLMEVLVKNRHYDCEAMLIRDSFYSPKFRSLAVSVYINKDLTRESSSKTGASNLNGACTICSADIAPLEITHLRYHSVERMSRLSGKACLQMLAR